ncbi:MAG: cation-translocating P-type ATPase, partial [Clostridiales bacterium]|nr:cation-translocating P-type ATPase [Clostridiales bacterium]
EAEERQKRGRNELVSTKPGSLFFKILDQLNEPMVYILIAAIGISVAVKEINDAVIILVVIAINVVVGLAQEDKAQKSLDALKKMSTPKTSVKRDGILKEIPIEELVVGDIVTIEAGHYIPADLRLMEVANLKIDESILTGESVPMEKTDGIVDEENIALGDVRNMAFMSSYATYGRGIGVVTSIGMDTEIGKIADMIDKTEQIKTPLQKRLEQLSKYLGVGTLLVSLLIFMLAIVQGKDLMQMLLVSISLAVAVIPEGLPAVITVVLALGVQKMIKQNAIVKKLPAVETLGSVNVICSDKTGTITQNKMKVVKVYHNGKLKPVEELTEEDRLLVDGFMLCNDASNEGDLIGDPTEVALLDMGEVLSIKKSDIEEKFPRIDEIPFDSDRKMMTTVNKYNGREIIFTKGALDFVLQRTTHILLDNEKLPIEDQEDEIYNNAHDMSTKALRVLALAYREKEYTDEAFHSSLAMASELAHEDEDYVGKTPGLLAEVSDSAYMEKDYIKEAFSLPLTEVPDLEYIEENRGEYENNLIFLGLVGMIDPPREEVREAVQKCNGAGIRTIMITGDHKDTAFAIAKEVGISQDTDQVMEGQTLSTMAQEELNGVIDNYRVFARVQPEHKVMIVKALQSEGYIVSMTGDGVNDAPSLKAADIGVAMGITGSDVSKEASDMILTDDNFATIIKAVEAGRNIYNNIKKTILFLLSCNLGELFALFTAVVLNWPVPLKPIHILWVNLITDTLPALSLGVDPVSEDVMKEKPRSREESIFGENGLPYLVLNGIFIGSIALAAFSYGLKDGNLVRGQTMALLVLSICQLFHSINNRNLRQSIFKIGIFKNRFLVYSIVLGIFLQIMIVHVPIFNKIFSTVPPSPMDWVIVLALSLPVILVNEIGKALFRGYKKRKQR